MSDVFLSFNSLDRPTVTRIAEELKTRGLEAFVDSWSLIPGRQWQGGLLDALKSYKSAAILLGGHGLDIWQHQEMQVALARQAREGDDFPVIPVLLPGFDFERTPLGFLELATWVDLRIFGDRDLDILAAAIRKEKPEPSARLKADALQQVNPYRGLGVFREEDAPFYFGRDALSAQLLETVRAHRFVGIVGASGSGKSSLARAGLLPALRDPKQNDVWHVIDMRPGDNPAMSLAEQLAPVLEPDLTEGRLLDEIKTISTQLNSAEDADTLRHYLRRLIDKFQGIDRVLLLIDQFEEIYTLSDRRPARLQGEEAVDDEIEDWRAEQQRLRTHFLDEIVRAATASELPAHVVVTLRGDYYHRVTERRDLAQLFNAAQVNVGPMTPEELRSAITGPAEKVNLRFETGLPELILSEIENEPR